MTSPHQCGRCTPPPTRHNTLMHCTWLVPNPASHAMPSFPCPHPPPRASSTTSPPSAHRAAADVLAVEGQTRHLCADPLLCGDVHYGHVAGLVVTVRDQHTSPTLAHPHPPSCLNSHQDVLTIIESTLSTTIFIFSSLIILGEKTKPDTLPLRLSVSDCHLPHRCPHPTPGSFGVDVSALVAGLGLTGFALGFALKDVCSNLLGWC